jgi:hypothetical protein
MKSYYGMGTGLPHHAKYEVYEKKLRGGLPSIELITWLLFAGALAVMVVRRKTVLATRELWLSACLLFGFGFLFYGTTVFAAPVVIRYWLPMHALKLAFVWMAMKKV